MLPSLNEDLFRAVRSVLLCLSELTESGSAPSGDRSDDSQLNLLQQEVTALFSSAFKKIPHNSSFLFGS